MSKSSPGAVRMSVTVLFSNEEVVTLRSITLPGGKISLPGVKPGGTSSTRLDPPDIPRLNIGAARPSGSWGGVPGRGIWKPPVYIY